MGEGWAWPRRGRRAHYFRDGRSLCGRWSSWPSSYAQNQELGSLDHCAKCARRRAKETTNAAPR